MQVRFHYTGTWAWWWEVDNVFLGSRTCDPVPGGLVAGTVTDANTNNGVDRRDRDQRGQAGRVGHHGGDTGRPEPGRRLLLDVLLADRQALVHRGEEALRVEDEVGHRGRELRPRRRSFNLAAGRITVTPTSIAKTVTWGKGRPRQIVTVKNTGGAPANVTLGEQAGGSTLLTAHGAPVNRVKGKYSPQVPARHEWDRDEGDRRQTRGHHAGRRTVDLDRQLPGDDPGQRRRRR